MNSTAIRSCSNADARWRQFTCPRVSRSRGTPRFIKSASGATITDVDGNTYVDYVGSWGPMILGHADEEVVAAIQEVAAKGTSFGAPTELEISLAREVIDAAIHRDGADGKQRHRGHDGSDPARARSNWADKVN